MNIYCQLIILELLLYSNLTLKSCFIGTIYYLFRKEAYFLASPCTLQIQFWKFNDSVNYRTEDIVFRVWNPCPLVAIGNEQVRLVTSVALPGPVYQPVVVSGSTNRLWPYSRLAAAVRTTNGASGGNLSNVVVFDTPEGGGSCSSCSKVHIMSK